MDRKASTFVAAFGATLFAQWAAQPHAENERFWEEASAVQRMLEDGVAKIPQPKLQAALRRDLARFVAQLQALLQAQYSDYAQQQKNKTQAKTTATTKPALPTLLNEEDVELALHSEADATAASVLAREDVLHAERLQEAVKTATNPSEFVAVVGECVERLRVVRARRFESARERDHIAAFYWRLIHEAASAAMQWWCDDARGLWCVLASKASDRERLRRLLQSLVVADAVTASASQEPWSAFFRPPLSPMFHSLDLTKARASVYGALLSLAVAFPVVYEDDSDADSTSGDSSSSSSDEDDNSDSDIDSPTFRHITEQKKQKLKKKDREECGAWAALVVRTIVLAAKREKENSGDWYLAVLAAFHDLPKPTQFVEEEDDEEEEEVLTTHQQNALDDARAELYARAFASSSTLWPQHQHAPLALLETVLCLRYATDFLRVQRKQTVAAVATATSQLVGVALPIAFWQWLAYVKKQYAGQDAVVQTVMKKLTKHKADKTKMANVLMQESVVTLAELRVVVEHFALYLATEKERTHFVVAHVPTASGDARKADADGAADQTLFFQDTDGGRSSKKRTPTADEKSARKRGRINTKA